MSGQDVAVYILLGAAIVYLAWRYLKPKKKHECGPDCKH